MGRKLISILILLAIVSVAGIITTQIYWLNKAFKVQETQLNLQKRQASAEAKQFNDRVTIALTNVADEILTINNDPAELFQAVKQIRPNYFTVAINDTVHPFLLENLLIREFERRNIGENFEYGVYDCFTDSIVYGNYVALNSDSVSLNNVEKSQLIKWDKDGHYFGVFFPDRKVYEMEAQTPKVTSWAFSAIISLIVFGFFAYAVYLIIRQRKLSEMKTDFINNMTHELRTPISTIGLSSQVLLDENIINQPQRLKDYAYLIFNENQRLKLQVDKVLQLATLEKKELEINYSRIDIHEIIKNAVKSVVLVREKDDLSISTQLTAERHAITGDEVHIGNVIHNLIDNALKYRNSQAKIEISTTNQSNKLLIMIKDNGIGIPGKSIPFIFDKFYRVHTGNIHDVKGFGLGLNYVQQIVHAHRGTISVKSEEGKGSEFTIVLPTE